MGTNTQEGEWNDRNRRQFQAIPSCLVLDDTGVKIQKEFWPSELGWKLHVPSVPFVPHTCQLCNQMEKKKKNQCLNSLTFGRTQAGFTSLILPAVPLIFQPVGI